MKKKLKIGLALGSGAARGFAHIGLLKVFIEHKIIPQYIAGSSIGSIIGALYAAGISPQMMEGIACNLDHKNLYDVCVPRHGFIRGNRIDDMMKLLTRDRDFNELEIPLAVTATDLTNCKRVIFTQGKVYRAVRASISIPGIFNPVVENDRVLVDGGILERVPVKAVREMGADVVIGVDVGFRGQHSPAGNIFETILQSLEVMEMEILKQNTQDCDMMIYPDVNDINPLGFDQVAEAVKAGETSALEALDQVNKVIGISAGA